MNMLDEHSLHNLPEKTMDRICQAHC